MMGLSMGTPGPEEVIKMATAMAMPAAAKRTLQDIASQLAALRDRQNEIGVLSLKLDTDRAAVDKRTAEVQQRSDALDAANAALNTRIAKFEVTVSEFEQKLAAHETALEQTP
jgi:chromosome segregation ATPase